MHKAIAETRARARVRVRCSGSPPELQQARILEMEEVEDGREGEKGDKRMLRVLRSTGCWKSIRRRAESRESFWMRRRGTRKESPPTQQNLQEVVEQHELFKTPLSLLPRSAPLPLFGEFHFPALFFGVYEYA